MAKSIGTNHHTRGPARTNSATNWVQDPRLPHNTTCVYFTVSRLATSRVAGESIDSAFRPQRRQKRCESDWCFFFFFVGMRGLCAMDLQLTSRCATIPDDVGVSSSASPGKCNSSRSVACRSHFWTAAITRNNLTR